MEIKRYLIDVLFQKDLTFEKDGKFLYIEEYMPERLGRMLEKLLKEEHEDMYLQMGLNEWEIHPSKKNAIVTVSARHERSVEQSKSIAMFYVNLENGQVALQGVQ